MPKDTKKKREKEKEEIREELRDANLLVVGEIKLIQERLKKGIEDIRIKILFEDNVRQLERDKLIIKTLYFLLDLDVFIPLQMYEAVLGGKKKEED